MGMAHRRTQGHLQLRHSKTTQETQLSLTNRSPRLEVSQGHQKHGIIPYIRHGFLVVSLKRAVFQIFDFKNVVTLNSRSEVTQGHSLKVVPFDKLCMVSY